jgi:hypothetical protein
MENEIKLQKNNNNRDWSDECKIKKQDFKL